MDNLIALAEQVKGCTACDLHRGRTHAVPGEGPDDAAIMLIGEGPGANEDRTGRPFVGAAGKFLEELLALAGLKRSEVYICNVVKCRPPGNRDPQPAEIAACAGYLDRQIALVNPQVIVTLGRFSMARWFSGQSISRIHGQPKVDGDRTVVPMFHPAAALHQERYRSLIMADFSNLPETVKQAMGTPHVVAAPISTVAPNPAPAALVRGAPAAPTLPPDPPAVAQGRLF